MIAKEYYNLGKIEILSKDVIIERNKNPNVPIEYRQWSKLTFDEAEQIAEEMGNGWRIPTMEELFFLQQYNDLKLLNFDTKEAYWSSKGLESDITDTGYYGEASQTSAWVYYFGSKRRGGIPKTERIRARLVRSV
jgi:hypothetical protein